MRTARVTLALVGLLAAAGCERRPDLQHPRRFDEGGLAFAYPGNWKVTVEKQTPAAVTVRQITVESPGTSILMIEEFTPAIQVETKEFLDRLLGHMNQAAAGKTRGIMTVAGLASQPHVRSILGQARTGLRYQFQIAVLGEKVPHTWDGYTVALPTRTLVFVAQAPDDERGRVGAGFDLVLESLEVR
jgi:hypothetical protein